MRAAKMPSSFSSAELELCSLKEEYRTRSQTPEAACAKTVVRSRKLLPGAPA